MLDYKYSPDEKPKHSFSLSLLSLCLSLLYPFVFYLGTPLAGGEVRRR